MTVPVKVANPSLRPKVTVKVVNPSLKPSAIATMGLQRRN